MIDSTDNVNLILHSALGGNLSNLLLSVYAATNESELYVGSDPTYNIYHSVNSLPFLKSTNVTDFQDAIF